MSLGSSRSSHGRKSGYQLNVNPEPCGLYQFLTEDRPHTALLESGDGTEGQPGQSLILERAALRIQIHNRSAEISPLTALGRELCRRMVEESPLRPFVEDTGEDRVSLRFPDPDPYLEDLERLTEPSPLDVPRCLLRVLEPVPADQRLLVGILNFELIGAFEDIPGMDLDAARAEFLLAERFVRIDHSSGRTQVVDLEDADRSLEAKVLGFVSGSPPVDFEEPSEFEKPSAEGEVAVDLDDQAFAQVVRQCSHEIERGEVFQVVPSRSFTMPCCDSFSAYQRLRRLNPSPYQFFVRSEQEVLFGASPETCVKVTPSADGPELTLRPIAGTRPRGRDQDGELIADLDNRLSAELVLDSKEQAEHMMLVDLARNDVARVCQAGSRRVTRLLALEHYSHVSHLVSEVRGHLRPSLDALYAYQACMNMGTLTGAPKLRATELIAQLEATPRGPYGGAVAYLLGDGGPQTVFDSAIVIRSAQVKDGVAQVRAGAGVVRDSDPQSEAEETRRKAEAVLLALRPGKTETAL